MAAFLIPSGDTIPSPRVASLSSQSLSPGKTKMLRNQKLNQSSLMGSEGEINTESDTMTSPPQPAYVRARPCTTQYLVSGAGWSAGFERPGDFLIFLVQYTTWQKKIQIDRSRLFMRMK